MFRARAVGRIDAIAADLLIHTSRERFDTSARYTYASYYRSLASERSTDPPGIWSRPWKLRARSSNPRRGKPRRMTPRGAYPVGVYEAYVTRDPRARIAPGRSFRKRRVPRFPPFFLSPHEDARFLRVHSRRAGAREKKTSITFSSTIKRGEYGGTPFLFHAKWMGARTLDVCNTSPRYTPV